MHFALEIFKAEQKQQANEPEENENGDVLREGSNPCETNSSPQFMKNE